MLYILAPLSLRLLLALQLIPIGHEHGYGHYYLLIHCGFQSWYKLSQQ